MPPVYDQDGITVLHGDCLDVLAGLPDASIDAVVTDPPYGLGNPDPAYVIKALERWFAGDRAHVPDSKGFMGRAWDAFVPPPAVWDECLRVLKPGGHLLAFAGSRTIDLMTLSIRLAGFEIRDGIAAWIYGSGFPKSLDVGKAIDKAAGAVREIVGQRTRADGTTRPNAANWSDGMGYMGNPGSARVESAPATDDARQWQGWGTALKPAHEPVVCARKPFNAVPSWETVSTVHHALGGLLWLSASPAKRAELASTSSHHVLPEDACASALAAAVVSTSRERSAPTDTYRSPALASTCLNIVSSWNAILDALSDPTTTFTTATASSTTTALKTLNSLLAPLTSPSIMPKCGCLHGGDSSTAQSADKSSSDAWAKWRSTLSASAPEGAIEGIALAASSALASVAADLSAEQEGASTAHRSAPTGPLTTDARSSSDSASTAASSTSHAGTPGGSALSAALGSLRPGSSAHEPIVMARKPLSGTVAANVLAHGTGALNIEACRVATTDNLNGGGYAAHSNKRAEDASSYATRVTGLEYKQPSGRWPSNVLFTHSPDCAVECAPGCPVAELDTQSGTSKSTGGQASLGAFRNGAVYGKGRDVVEKRDPGFGDTGGASRFFPTFRYQAKAPTSERPKVNGIAHSTVKPLTLMRWLVRLVTPPGGTVLDPFLGSGTTAQAARDEGFRCIGIEREDEYLDLIQARLDRPPSTAQRLEQDALPFGEDAA